MSDHGHHDPGGHELDAVNTKLLFRLLFGLTGLTLLACIAVVQWFYSQRRELDNRHAVEGSFQLQQYQGKMAKDLEGLDQVAQDIAANPALLAAPPPPSGWIHPDDLVGGTADPAAPAEAPAQEQEVEPEPEPVADPAVEGEAPEGEDAEGEDAEAAEPAKPAKTPEPAAEEADKPQKPVAEEPGKPKPTEPEPKPEAEPDGE
ncbi:hypothetical protein ENSA5_30470 [Enhygromyxa salina]|uniref:Uncharacterized protein n=1 Tax=Enhygromyxa salina TaxID=215803 RepID=A0A2S9XZM7_9BACT|nr:hypothetical protein [Enhygromyxa salina]PRP98314.1 hypothetical protein ENSA5_30470 [Enhygromyxa salina]